MPVGKGPLTVIPLPCSQHQPLREREQAGLFGRSPVAESGTCTLKWLVSAVQTQGRRRGWELTPPTVAGLPQAPRLLTLLTMLKSLDGAAFDLVFSK